MPRWVHCRRPVRLWKRVFQILSVAITLEDLSIIFHHEPSIFEHSSQANNNDVPLLTSSFATRSIAVDEPEPRFDWRNLQVKSSLGLKFQENQGDCTIPTGHFWYRNRFGLGSDLHVWSQALCNAVQAGVRLRTIQEWIWKDERCGSDDGNSSTMSCYFPRVEPVCPNDSPKLSLARGRGRVRNDCQDFLDSQNSTVSQLRASATEFLFSSVSQRVYDEVRRQLAVVFRSPVVPTNLITVHIRWGDKVDEMDLVSVDKYVSAVEEIVKRRNYKSSVNIFLATEDPRALYEFASAAPKTWKIFVDAYFQEFYMSRDKVSASYNAAPRLAQTMMGRPGLLSLGSLLVAMEANDFVLTTASNWSRLLDEIRVSLVDPRCDGCTSVADLLPGQW